MTSPPTDPPMLPNPDAAHWVETGPEPIRRDPEMAAIIVRLGLAANALAVQIGAGYDAGQMPEGVVKLRANLAPLSAAAAFTYEAKRLAHRYMGQLRPLVMRAGGTEELLEAMGQLIAGKHPAEALLQRARNSLAFHWDYEDDIVGDIVRDFGRNETVIWVEETAPDEETALAETVHRLACEVLAHGLLPEAGAQRDQEAQRVQADRAIEPVIDAMRLLGRFFTVAVVRYLKESGCHVRFAKP